jgi:hypothetical protein
MWSKFRRIKMVRLWSRLRCIKLVRLKTRSHSVRDIAVLNSQPFAGCSLSADVAQRFSNVPVLFRWGVAGMKWGFKRTSFIPLGCREN